LYHKILPDCFEEIVNLHFESLLEASVLKIIFYLALHQSSSFIGFDISRPLSLFIFQDFVKSLLPEETNS